MASYIFAKRPAAYRPSISVCLSLRLQLAKMMLMPGEKLKGARRVSIMIVYVKSKDYYPVCSYITAESPTIVCGCYPIQQVGSK